LFTFSFDIKDLIIVLRAQTKEERNQWFRILQYHVKNAPPILETLETKRKTQVAPAAVLKSNIVVGSRDGAIIMTPLSYLVSGNTWQERLALLDSEGMIHLYRNDFKDYKNGLPPLEVIDIKSSIAIRNGPDSKTFHITKTNTSLHFMTTHVSLADDWVLIG
jgi:hypothetical protein